MSFRAANRISRIAAAVAAGALMMGATVPAGAVTSDTPATGNESQVAKPANDKQRYCIVERTTDSRIDRKTCKTRADWIKTTGFDPVTIAR